MPPAVTGARQLPLKILKVNRILCIIRKGPPGAAEKTEEPAKY
jgi:hypothetical protein